MTGPSDTAEQGVSLRRFWLVAAGLTGIGIALRVAMGFESFWLDEVWSLAIAQRAGSALDVVTRLQHDNNHPLNTLYLRAVADVVGSGHWISFRIPSLVAGVLSLGLVAAIAWRWGRLEALFALALTATSFPLVSASAQARGYAGAILFGLAYVYLTRSLAEPAHGRRPGGAWVAALWGVGLLGMSSHATFVYPLAGAVAWTVVRGTSLRRTGWLHAVPIATAAAWIVGFYAQVDVGGGPSYERWVALREAIAQTMSLPRRGPATWAAMLAGLGLAGAGLRVLWRGGRRPAVALFTVTLVAAPAAVIVVSNPKLLYARYLVTTFPWFYLLLAVALAAAWRRTAGLRAIAAAILAFFVLSNGWHGVRVLREGRNDYLQTVQFIDRETRGPALVIGSDHDFRNATVLRFYAARIASGRPLAYVTRDAWPAQGPEWYLRHDWQAGHTPEVEHEPAPGLHYRLVQSFEHGAGDGYQWFIYRRERSDD